MRSLVLFAAIVFTGLSGISSCSSSKPENIIFLIGDGMGLSAVSAGFYYGEGDSPFGRFDEIGLITTSSSSHKITDSAASGTAMSSGKKTYNGAVGVDSSGDTLQSITELVSKMDWSTGVVATSSITHATPASFYAHVKQRGMEEEIAAQLLESDIDFFAGGGIRFFNQRTDGQDLIAAGMEKGFKIDTTALPASGNSGAGQKFGYLLASGGMPSMVEGRGDFLPRATDLAIETLSQNQEGFFLMVEGSQIDWEAHDNLAEGVIEEVLDFGEAIQAALEFAETNGNTLVVVTADHETGGFALGPHTNPYTGMSNSNQIMPTFATGKHSATLIPVFASGPGAEQFGGVYDNTEIFLKMKALLEK